MIVAYPCPPRSQNADISVFRAVASVEPGPGRTFIEVLNPFARAQEAGIDLLGILDEDPSRGETKLNAFADETRAALESASAYDGVFYRVVGACPDLCTPMQYGGHFLEVDRELLKAVSVPLIVFIEGSDIYLDFVSDLPCTWMSWDTTTNSISLEEAQAMRAGEFLLPGGVTEAELVLAEAATVS